MESLRKEKGNAGAKFTLVTGGARSGKSDFAQSAAETEAKERKSALVYLATAEALDSEMEERIALHRAGRTDKWRTVEAPIDPASELTKVKSGSVVLLDCITLWVSNLMGIGLEDADIMEKAGLFFVASSKAARSGTSVFLVTNEVGSGIVPDNPLSRRFRDLAGRINAAAAKSADEAYLIVAGLAFKLK